MTRCVRAGLRFGQHEDDRRIKQACVWHVRGLVRVSGLPWGLSGAGLCGSDSTRRAGRARNRRLHRRRRRLLCAPSSSGVSAHFRRSISASADSARPCRPTWRPRTPTGRRRRSPTRARTSDASLQGNKYITALRELLYCFGLIRESFPSSNLFIYSVLYWLMFAEFIKKLRIKKAIKCLSRRGGKNTQQLHGNKLGYKCSFGSPDT